MGFVMLFQMQYNKKKGVMGNVYGEQSEKGFN